jgi:catechol 2,3-dioxygenase-like lactoylglutathione lyase family enzyme
MWAIEVEARVFTSVRKICQDFGAAQCILTLRLVGQARGLELTMIRCIVFVCLCLVGGCASTPATDSQLNDTGDESMQLGNFSVSLAVKDLAASREFYEKLGLKVVSGDAKQNWLVLANETSRIGIFQGMFDKNMLTFNPGWDSEKNTLPKFDDVREIQKKLKNQGIALTAEADESSTGPAYIMLSDPDGNPILIDQHVDKPKKK